MIPLVFLVAALVLFIIHAVGVPAGRINLMAAGLACYIASLLVGHL
jgi:hypothetical protein